jgi:hypothetical protein
LTRPIAIELRPSRRLIAFLVLGHVMAFLAAIAGLPGPAAGLVSAALILSLAVQLQAALLRRVASVMALRVAANGAIEFRGRDGSWHPADLDGQAYASPWLLVVRLAPAVGAVRCVVLLGDSGDADQMRRLRVWLQWGGDGRARRDARSGPV